MKCESKNIYIQFSQTEACVTLDDLQTISSSILGTITAWVILICLAFYIATSIGYVLNRETINLYRYIKRKMK